MASEGWVARERTRLCEEHEWVPSRDLYSDHKVLSEDEGGEGDAHHMDKALLEEEDASEHDHAALVQRLPRP